MLHLLRQRQRACPYYPSSSVKDWRETQIVHLPRQRAYHRRSNILENFGTIGTQRTTNSSNSDALLRILKRAHLPCRDFVATSFATSTECSLSDRQEAIACDTMCWGAKDTVFAFIRPPRSTSLPCWALNLLEAPGCNRLFGCEFSTKHMRITESKELDNLIERSQMEEFEVF